MRASSSRCYRAGQPSNVSTGRPLGTAAGNQSAQVGFLHPLVQQSVLTNCTRSLNSPIGQHDPASCSDGAISASVDHRAHLLQVRGNAGVGRVVARRAVRRRSGGSEWRPRDREGAVVEEAGRHREVAQRRGAELIAIRGVAGALFAAEVLVIARAREREVAGGDAELRERPAARRATCSLKSLNISFDLPSTRWHDDAVRLAEEQQRAALLRRRSSRCHRRARTGRSARRQTPA